MMEHQDQWDVRFLNWKVFTDAVIKQSGRVWQDICKAHFLFGGVNFTNNFL
jgi:hypothetical protein